MDAAYLRERAAICLRLANGLSWNNPARSQLLDLAEDFNRRARNSETPRWLRVAMTRTGRRSKVDKWAKVTEFANIKADRSAAWCV